MFHIRSVFFIFHAQYFILHADGIWVYGVCGYVLVGVVG
jgi:hypothetical protein